MSEVINDKSVFENHLLKMDSAFENIRKNLDLLEEYCSVGFLVYQYFPKLSAEAFAGILHKAFMDLSGQSIYGVPGISLHEDFAFDDKKIVELEELGSKVLEVYRIY